MNKNTSVSIGKYFDEFVQAQINTGRYKNVSEVIRAGLRLLENEESKTKALREALAAGIESGHVEKFDPSTNLSTLKARKKSLA
jgi:antitoxin ParD1/3/4